MSEELAAAVLKYIEENTNVKFGSTGYSWISTDPFGIVEYVKNTITVQVGKYDKRVFDLEEPNSLKKAVKTINEDSFYKLSGDSIKDLQGVSPEDYRIFEIFRDGAVE